MTIVLEINYNFGSNEIQVIFPGIMAEQLPILTVSQLTNAIKHCLESTFPMVWIQGEVSNAKLHTSGHFYFSIKDATSQITAVMYRAEASQLATIPKDGTQILVRGEINVYPPKGNYQILVRELKPVGIGELLQKLEELKVKLLKKGYFKKERKRPLPKFPKTIGVVTSPTGAAIQDILHILTRRYSGFHLILNPVKVQGEGAAAEIAKAIEQFNRHDLVDVIIVGRGGGSLEDLWAFNEEIVAEAIYQSRIPIIAAVGHETDHCIAEYVADVRAPTPSAAAEIVIAEKAHQLHLLDQTKQRLTQSLQHLIRHDKRRLEGILRHPLVNSPYGILGPWMQKLDDLRQEIDRSLLHKISNYQTNILTAKHRLQGLNPKTQLGHFKQRLEQYGKAMDSAILAKIVSWKKRLDPESRRRRLDHITQLALERKQRSLSHMAAALQLINPKNLLAKGFAIPFAEKDDSVIKSVSDLKVGMSFRLLLSDGEAISTVKQLRSSDE